MEPIMRPFVLLTHSAPKLTRFSMGQPQPSYPCFIRVHPWLKIDMQSARDHLHSDHGDRRKEDRPQ